MGGANEAVCSKPAPASVIDRIPDPTGQQTTKEAKIRYHENTQLGEVHFHDDENNIKCAVDSSMFWQAYHAWRTSGKNELKLSGHDGNKGYSKVNFLLYTDDIGELQVNMSVEKAAIGKTLIDLDKLAQFGKI